MALDRRVKASLLDAEARWPEARKPRHKSRRPAFAGRPVDVVRKPSSVLYRGRPRYSGGHSSRAAVTGRLEQPTRELGRVTLRGLPLRRDTARSLMWPCSRWGLPCRLRHRRRGGLLPRRFTLSCRACFQTRPVVSSLLHFPSRSRDRALPGIVLSGARTFLPPRFVLSARALRTGSRPAIACTASTGRKVTLERSARNGQSSERTPAP